MGNSAKRPNKLTALITYVIALVCLLLGLLLPLGPVDGFNVSNMLGWQLPQAVNALFGKTVLKFGAAFTYSLPVQFFGLKSFDIGALFCLLYGLVTVAGLIALVPVIASKKTSRTAIKAASFIEVLALVFLAPLFFIQLETYLGLYLGGKFAYALLIAFGGALVMLIVQAFAYKGSSGFFKFILFLLSGIAVFFIMFPISGFIPALGTALGGKLATGLYGNGSFGIVYMYAMFHSNVFASLIGDAKIDTMTVITLITAVLVFINFMCDMMGLGKRTNRAMLTCNIIRYVLEVAAIIVMIIMTFVISGISLQIMLIVLAVIAVIQLLINVIRFVKFRRRRGAKVKPAKVKKEKNTEPAVVVAAPVAEEKPDKKAEKLAAKQAKEAEKEAAREAKEAEKVAAREAKEAAKQQEATSAKTAAAAPAAAKDTTVYNVEPLYNGPVDDFIKKLTNSERIEFAQVFLERAKCPLNNVPDYVVGGNNSKFFSAVFIYYGRVRDYISDGLMNKLYEQGNMMN